MQTGALTPCAHLHIFPNGLLITITPVRGAAQGKGQVSVEMEKELSECGFVLIILDNFANL